MNGKRYGIKSNKCKYETVRRAKRKELSVEEMLAIEEWEQKQLDNGLRYCAGCKSWKIFKNSYCNKCCAKKARKYYSNEKQRKYILQKKFGITLDEYDKMREGQDYKCAICGKDEYDLDRSLAVDHCHKTGKIRKLLCSSCNLLLGQIDDDIEIVKNMLEYLKKNK